MQFLWQNIQSQGSNECSYNTTHRGETLCLWYLRKMICTSCILNFVLTLAQTTLRPSKLKEGAVLARILLQICDWSKRFMQVILLVSYQSDSSMCWRHTEARVAPCTSVQRLLNRLCVLHTWSKHSVCTTSRPPQSALSARLSSRHIMINLDVAGTF